MSKYIEITYKNVKECRDMVDAFYDDTPMYLELNGKREKFVISNFHNSYEKVNFILKPLAEEDKEHPLITANKIKFEVDEERYKND